MKVYKKMQVIAPKYVAIYGYKMVSKAVRALQKELGIVQLLHEGSHYKGDRDKCVINYGASYLPPNILKSRILNKPTSVQMCINKLDFFSHLYAIEAPVSTPDWTQDPEVAKKWIENNEVLLARMNVMGSGGKGIKILNKRVDFVKAPLYTKYIPKQFEFRVHVLDGEVVDIQRKVLQRDNPPEGEAKKIRSHANGWIFTRNPDLVKLPCAKIEQEAVNAVAYMDLDFGAVDVIWSKRLQNAFVLEVNTAPGLEGQSVQIWGDAFRDFLGMPKKEEKK